MNELRGNTKPILCTDNSLCYSSYNIVNTLKDLLKSFKGAYYFRDCSRRSFLYDKKTNDLEVIDEETYYTKNIFKRKRNIIKALKLINLEKLELVKEIKSNYNKLDLKI